MDKIIFVFRNGAPENIGEKFQEILEDRGVQDNVFLLDVKSHSIELLAEVELMGVINQLQTFYGISIIKALNGMVVFGKLQDGKVVKAIQSQAKRLF